MTTARTGRNARPAHADLHREAKGTVVAIGSGRPDSMNARWPATGANVADAIRGRKPS
jgi:hypothetical protein